MDPMHFTVIQFFLKHSQLSSNEKGLKLIMPSALERFRILINRISSKQTGLYNQCS